jgi:two-component system, chemotaxis family, protein-glutamate methylesterase/glutaminase
MTKTVNTDHIKRDIVVIGASAGGVAALITLFQNLPSPLPGAVVVVLHRHPLNNVKLPTVLGRATPLPIIEASGEGPLQAGTIQLAPGDAHLILTEDGVRLDRGPKEHFTRPAVDPLFRSAAAIYGPRVTGVLLTGAGDDGVRGLIHIKASGGLAVIQDPAQAMMPSMPMNALLYDHVDLVLPLADIASTLISLMRGDPITRSTASQC